MADAAQIAELRKLIDEPDQTSYTDEVLSARIDNATTLRGLASSIWQEKAAQYAGLVDVREGNSDRKLSQLYANAQKMSTFFGTDEDTSAGVRRPTRTRRIERQ